MKIILENRSNGKTFKAIFYAYMVNGIIITSTEKNADTIIEMSKEMNTPIKAVGINEYLQNKDKYRGKITIIDELQLTLSSLIDNLVYATDSNIEIIDLKQIGGK